MLEKISKGLGIVEPEADSFCGTSCVHEVLSSCTLNFVYNKLTQYTVCIDGNRTKTGC